MTFSTILFNIADMIGCVAFALSGAMVALKHRLDLFGIVTLAVVTALGGGLTRDLIIGCTPPMMFRDPVYALVAASVAILIFLVARFSGKFYHRIEPHIEVLANIFDALGLGAFTVVGMQTGIRYGYSDNGFFLIFLSLITCVGGGLLRDLFVQRMPAILHKHVYAVAVLAGAIVYLILYRSGISDVVNVPVTMIMVFIIRMLATYFHWNLPRIKDIS